MEVMLVALKAVYKRLKVSHRSVIGDRELSLHRMKSRSYGAIISHNFKNPIQNVPCEALLPLDLRVPMMKSTSR
jgi:hypothetical protein